MGVSFPFGLAGISCGFIANTDCGTLVYLIIAVCDAAVEVLPHNAADATIAAGDSDAVGVVAVFDGAAVLPHNAADIPAAADAAGGSVLAAAGAVAAGKRPCFCRHKIFGRGKILGLMPPNKVQVSFAGFGIKVILADYLQLED